jgi:hypothetical protein
VEVDDRWMAGGGSGVTAQAAPHTARRVWQRLVDEHDAHVGEPTVSGTHRMSRLMLTENRAD